MGNGSMKSAKMPEAEFCESASPDMLVRVSFHNGKDGAYVMGVARDRKTHRIILPKIKHTKKCLQGESLESCKRTVVSLVSASYKDKVSGAHGNATLPDSNTNRFLLALDTYLDKKGKFSGWAQSTQNQYCRFYTRVFGILRDLQDNAILTDVDLEPVKSALANQVSASKNSYKNAEKNENRVKTIIHHASSVYQIVTSFLKEEYPDMHLPELKWSTDNPKKSVKEQPKMLDPETREKFCRIIHDQVEDNPALAKGAVLMMLNLRTAEAAAVEEKDVSFCNDEKVGLYSIIKVFYQSQDGVQKTPILKTKQSTRTIPAGYWHTEVLKKCFAVLRKTGENAMTSSGELSEWVLEKLKEAGCRVENIMPPASDLADVGSLAAYILRRDSASLMKNQMGMSSYEIDKQMGHKTKGNKAAHPDLQLAEEQKKLVAKMNRFCYMRTITKAPAVTPIQLAHGKELQTIDYDKLCLQMPQYASRCELEFRASEPGESISIICPAELADKLQTRSRSEPYIIKPALGCVTKEEDYEKAED